MKAGPRSMRAFVTSLVTHVLLVGVALRVATGPHVAIGPRDTLERVELVRLPERVMPADVTASIPALHRREFRILVAPLDIPSALPPIDVHAPVTRASDFSGVGIPGMVASIGLASVVTPDAYTDDEVDRKASRLPGQIGNSQAA